MNQEKVGNFIKEIRKNNNMTQKEFADKLGVTFQAVSKWENGKNIPDISTLKEISKLFDINIEELINGESKKRLSKKKNFPLIILCSIILILLLTILLILIFPNKKNSDFEFKQISTTCDNFNITGSVAYNEDKSSLHISSVEFCGQEDNEQYENISCSLYEDFNNTKIKISSCTSKENTTLESYLSEVKINANNYSTICKEFPNSNLYIEINATTKEDKIITYKIPITLENNCE